VLDQKVMEQYLREVPFEMRLAIMELKSDVRWAVYIALMTEGIKTHSEIRDLFKANPNTTTSTLTGLVDGGLVARRINKMEGLGDKRMVYYEPTNMGIRLFKALDYIAVPPRTINNRVLYRAIISPEEITEIGTKEVQTNHGKTAVLTTGG